MVKTEEEKRDTAMQTVNIFRGNDWDLKEETPEFFLLTRAKKINWFLFIVLLCFYIFPGIIYLVAKAIPETKKVFK